MKDTFIKTITLLTFLCLVIGFVAYQAGYLGEVNGIKQFISLSPNGSALNNQMNTVSTTNTNSPAVQYQTEEPYLIPSSKVLIIRQPHKTFNDSLVEIQRDSMDSIIASYKSMMMSSSKSGQVFTDEDVLEFLKNDSIRKHQDDSQKKRKKSRFKSNLRKLFN